MALTSDWDLFKKTWFTPSHSLFFPKQYWKRFWYRKYFSSIEKYPLTLRQRQAIIVDENRNLIIAGAGTGKTSTVVGKVGYLLKAKKCLPNEILVIAYNRNAAAELRDRIKEKLDAEPVVGTFHSIGKEILFKGKHPSRPSEFVDQEEKLLKFMERILNRCLTIGDFAKLYEEYFREHEVRNVDEVREFTTEREYANWIRCNSLLTLQNEKVKSHGEFLIANFLFANNVKYKYETFYSANNSMPTDFHYRPDFYLPEHNIYIEYFGIDEDGQTADFIPQQQYNEGMSWKFKTHREGNTKLIDLYFHQKKNGTLIKTLKEQLDSHGVELSPVPKEKLYEQINTTKKDAKFLKLVVRFLSQYKERKRTLDLRKLSEKYKNDQRTLLFLRLFEVLLNAYQNELSKNRRIDFGDMISQSAKLIFENRAISNYKYIIIDEFQDISDGRYNLISEMLLQNPHTKLFCVGDDWQAIYRFAGSDHKIMTNFEGMFGNSTILKLDETFRYNDRIAEVSEKFITSNPTQIKKNLKTFSKNDHAQVFVHWHSDDISSAIQNAIKKIKNEYDLLGQNLLILTRYNHTKLEGEPLRELHSLWGDGGKIEQRTVHSSKGLESDFVIVADLQSDHFGFPSEIQDDPILKLVLAEEDNFEDSEERRLFYVALTRAKKQVHLICDGVSPSRFAEELSDGRYDVIVTGSKENKRKCPSCSDGVIIKRHGRNGDFYSCYNHPVCDFKPLECSHCKSDIVMRFTDEEGKVSAQCLNEECLQLYEKCGGCASGVLKKIKGSRGDFLGCHDFSRTQCKFTKDIQVEIETDEFTEWSDHFEDFISNFNFSNELQFTYTKQEFRDDGNVEFEISFEQDSEDEEFLIFKVNLGEFTITIPNSISNLEEATGFEYDQDAFAILEAEIIQRRSLFGIAHPLDAQDEIEISEQR